MKASREQVKTEERNTVSCVSWDRADFMVGREGRIRKRKAKMKWITGWTQGDLCSKLAGT